ncbi:unnamed protein product [Cylicostephanus goldi]|uniref:Uncharacterized protein n=1 Tax=Cylicostephanus goldi TaxID=71465 RepID=A0A3P6R7D0_CYLGO|nr:unnamed protein product [Cylicostephanus goldi]
MLQNLRASSEARRELDCFLDRNDVDLEPRTPYSGHALSIYRAVAGPDRLLCVVHLRCWSEKEAQGAGYHPAYFEQLRLESQTSGS